MHKTYLLSLLLFSLPLNTQASGGGGGSGGGSSSGGGGGGGSFNGGFGKRALTKVNAERFESGKAVFEGNFEPASRVSFSTKNTQSRNLIQLMRRLAKVSKPTAKLLDVEKLAGTMSANDFRALRYYLDVKYLRTEKYKSEFNKKNKKK